jgi:hypothetical protein
MIEIDPSERVPVAIDRAIPEFIMMIMRYSREASCPA